LNFPGFYRDYGIFNQQLSGKSESEVVDPWNYPEIPAEEPARLRSLPYLLGNDAAICDTKTSLGHM
jgi:hypothetical protein